MASVLEDEGLDNLSARQLADWDPFDQNASSTFFDPEWMFDISDGFDVVIGNPPYLKERDNASFFDPINKSDFGKKWHQGKMDFWYYFLHKAIDLSSSEICFITSRYWLNSQGAKKLISRISDELFFVNVVDIGKLKVFDAVAGHHMVSHFSKNKKDQFLYIKIEEDISSIENWKDNKNVKTSKLFNSEVFSESGDIILAKDEFTQLEGIEQLGEFFEVSQGVVEASDKISSRQLKSSNLNSFKVGQGIFVLTENELQELNLNTKEQEYVKPYVDPNDILKYSINFKDKKFLIYSDSSLKDSIANDSSFNNLKMHLDKLSPFITSSNKPYGLHRPRKQEFFERPKIIFKGMFADPEFEYDDSKLYFGMSFLSIIQKKGTYSLKYLLGILNSKFARKWFYTHGKQRGAGVDIGVGKIRLFPVKKADSGTQTLLSTLVDCARQFKHMDLKGSKPIENTIDATVFNLYFSDHMREREIDVLEYVKRDMDYVLQGREFDNNLDDAEKEKMVEQLHATWSAPENEVVKRMAQFKEKSPEILKVIMES